MQHAKECLGVGSTALIYLADDNDEEEGHEQEWGCNWGDKA